MGGKIALAIAIASGWRGGQVGHGLAGSGVGQVNHPYLLGALQHITRRHQCSSLWQAVEGRKITLAIPIASAWCG